MQGIILVNSCWQPTYLLMTSTQHTICNIFTSEVKYTMPLGLKSVHLQKVHQNIVPRAKKVQLPKDKQAEIDP